MSKDIIDLPKHQGSLSSYLQCSPLPITKSMRIANFILIIIFLCLSSIANAQEYKVESFEITPNDLSARTEGRVDGNGRKCAIIKVYVKDVITDTDGPTVGEIRNRGMEKWVYVSHDAKQVGFLFKEHMPLNITFGDYNYPSLTGQMTYILKLTEDYESRNDSQTLTHYLNTSVGGSSSQISSDKSKDAVIDELANKFTSLYNIQLGNTSLQDIENSLKISKKTNKEGKIEITTKDNTDINFDSNNCASLISIHPRRTKKMFPNIGGLSWKSSFREWNDWFISNGFEYKKYDPYYGKQATLVYSSSSYLLIFMFNGGENERDWFCLIISKKED